MTTFEEAFTDVESAAGSALKAVNSLASLARQMHRAAQDGNIGNMRRCADRMLSSMKLVRQEVDNAASAWPFDDAAEEQYLREFYAAELKKTAAANRLRIDERDGRLIAHPSVLRILANERAVRVDRRRVSAIRPTKLTTMLLSNQQRRPRFRTETFLEALYRAYLMLVGRERTDRLLTDREAGPVIPLLRIYDVFTSLPGSSRDYDQTDFARDLFFLESSSVRQVKSGARVSFHASTGTRRASGTLSFVGPDGELVIYYGIQFSGGSR